jgi:hypothetical protein
MPKKDELPRFIIFHPNTKEFYICLEAKGKFLRWCSFYAPSMDIGFPRHISKIKDISIKDVYSKHIFDQGTYTTAKADTKQLVEAKVIEGIKARSFAFILNGNILKGRFAIKKVRGGAIIQKYKDKYAVTEDVLSNDLSRTISTMVPNYDEKMVQLHPRTKAKEREPEILANEDLVEEITSEKQIANVEYHFAFYKSNDEPDICVVTSEDNHVLILRKEGSRWSLAKPLGQSILRKESVFIEHCQALYEQNQEGDEGH